MVLPEEQPSEEHPVAVHQEDATTSEDAGRCIFFELSQELRDQIYNEATMTLTLQLTKNGQDDFKKADNWAQIDYAPCPAMFLVSKQFSQEYRAHMRQRQRLHLHVDENAIVSLQAKIRKREDTEFTGQLRSVQHLDIAFNKESWEFSSDPECYMAYHLHIASTFLPNLRRITINLGMGISYILDPAMRPQFTAVSLMAGKDYVCSLLSALYDQCQVTVSLLLESQAYSALLSLASTNPTPTPSPDPVKAMDRIDKLMWHPKNLVLYRASPFDAVDTWHKGDLAVVGESSYTFQEVEEDVVSGRTAKRIGYKIL